MEIDSKYRLEQFPLTLRVIEAFDFREEPILLLEKDTIGNNFLSYLVESNGVSEQRVYLQVSEARLGSIVDKDLSLYNAFLQPENNHVYIAQFSLTNGEVMSSYILPTHVFAEINPIPQKYSVDIEYSINDAFLDTAALLDYSESKRKLVLDFYLQGQNLISNIKPYAIYKILTPIVEIIKSLVGFDNRNADKYLAFSNLRQSSLGVTIEINYSKDLFLQKESEALETLIYLLNAQEKEDFAKIVSKTKNEKYIKEYSTIIKAIIENDANLHAAYANPINKILLTSFIDKKRAEKAKTILDESFDIIEDIEEIIGTFLEIDVDSREPSFKIYSFEDQITVKGKFELSILDKVKNDFVNIGKEEYKFTIKTLYFPETTLKTEEIKRYIVDYEKRL